MLSFLMLLALAFGFLNGFHDAANSIATVVSTRLLRPLHAVAWAAVFNFLAIVLLQTGVATTIATGLVQPSAIGPAVVFGALVAAIVWNLITLRLGIPVSSSHALVCALLGATLAAAGPAALVADGVVLFLLFVLLSPLIGLALGMTLMVMVLNLFQRVAARGADRLFRALQLVSSALYSIGHGSNDAQKTVGIIWLLLISSGGASTEIAPGWVGFASYAAIAAGTLLGGWRIVRTMGQRIVKLTPAGGFCSESAGAGAIHLASFFGIPISTTQTITASIIGVGIVNRLSSVRWGIAGVILWAWLLTMPAAGLLGALAWYLGRGLFLNTLVLPPLTGSTPRRLLILLHGAGSSAGAVVSAALAWQLKLRSAQAVLPQAPFAGPQQQRYWVDPAEYPITATSVGAAARQTRRLIEAQQAAVGVSPAQTLVVGFSQGASVALELAFGDAACAAITIGYAARLYRLPSAQDRVGGEIHLLHGAADSVVPAAYGEMAYRRLRAIGARVSLDLMPDEGHSIGQVQINRGTQYAMDRLFDRGGQAPPSGSRH